MFLVYDGYGYYYNNALFFEVNWATHPSHTVFGKRNQFDPAPQYLSLQTLKNMLEG